METFFRFTGPLWGESTGNLDFICFAVIAEWRHSGRHSDRSMDATDRPKGAQWWYKEGRSVARIDTQCSQQYVFFTRRPMADHCASILPPRRCVCLPPASFERPVSDRPPRRPFCDCFEHVQNFTATMASMAMSERPVYHHWTTKATVLPPFCLQRRPGQFVVAQWRQNGRSPCVKGVLVNRSSGFSFRHGTWLPHVYDDAFNGPTRQAGRPQTPRSSTLFQRRDGW